jgi:hypothetical protein
MFPVRPGRPHLTTEIVEVLHCTERKHAHNVLSFHVMQSFHVAARVDPLITA